MTRPTGDILGMDGDPTPGVVESVRALAKQFGDFAHVEAAYRSLNSFGADANALQWDVIGPEGEYVFVGGPAKAGNPSKFGRP